MVHQRRHYTQYLHYNIPSDWVIHDSPSGYIDRDGWHKFMSHFSSMCLSSPLNPQVLFYDGHGSQFNDRALYIICRHNIQSFILKSGDSMHGQPNDNIPNMKLNNLYGNEIMNWMRHHGDLKFAPAHMNSVLIETWEDFKLPSVTITQKYFKKTHPPSPFTHQKLLSITNIVLLVLNSQIKINRMRLDVQQSPLLRLYIWKK